LAKADSAKEEIGWLKVAFAVFAAVDASLLAWLAQTYTHGAANTLLGSVASIVAAALSAYVAWINIVAYRKIRELRDL
jgi:hypothetical protein